MGLAFRETVGSTGAGLVTVAVVVGAGAGVTVGGGGTCFAAVEFLRQPASNTKLLRVMVSRSACAHARGTALTRDRSLSAPEVLQPRSGDLLLAAGVSPG